MKQFRRIADNQRGFALPVVLVLLALGGLIIVPTLNYTSTALNSCRIIRAGTEGIYAADAGIEYAIWNIQNGQPPPDHLPQTVNGLNVSLTSNDHGAGTYTLYMGAFVETNVHFSYLNVRSSIEPVSGNVYKYTITVRRLATCTIHLDQVGARLPEGFTYQAGSADAYANNITRTEPYIVNDGTDYLVNWGDPHDDTKGLKKKIDSDDPYTQTFHITGDSARSGQYAWVVARPDSIDVVGEITGSYYEITSTASDPDSVQVAQIRADVMVVNDEAKIISWQVSR